MKTLCTLFLCILSAGVLSQPVERSYQPYFHSEASTFLKSGNNYFIGYSLHDPFQGFLTGVELAMYDSAGSLVWNLPVFDLGWKNYRISDAAVAGDSNIVIAGFIHLCDVSQGRTALEKINRNGVQQWYKEYEYAPDHQVVCLSGGNILCTIGSRLYFLDANGDSVKAVAFPYDVKSVCETPDNFLLIGTDTMFYRCNSSGNVLDSIPVAATSLDIIDSNRYLVAGGDSIMLFDSSLTVIASWVPPSGHAQLRKVQSDGSNVLAISTNAAVDYIVKLSSDLSSFQVYSLPYNLYEITDIAQDDSSYVVAGNQVRHENRSFYIKEFDTAFVSVNYNKDAGITDIQLDSLVIDTAGWQISPCHISFKASVTIMNYGNSVLNTVNANIVFPQTIGSCYPYGEVKRLNSLAIAPGDTKTVFLGHFAESNYFNAAANIYTVCFWSSIPDDFMDINLDNDKTCEDFTPTVVGINENEGGLNFTIYPNPSGEWLTIERSIASAMHMNIFTLAGNLVESRSLNEKTEVISISHLPSSGYLIMVGEGEIAFRKLFIKH